MKLSEAILLGDSLKNANWGSWLSRDSAGVCGCALGGAMLASGTSLEQYRESPLIFEEQLREKWPWLADSQRMKIGQMYKEHCAGRRTLEQLVDYVRSIEPAEDEADPRDEEGSDVRPELEVYKGRLREEGTA